MTYCEWLYRIDSQERERWEPEIFNLGLVSRAGVSVPPSFVVSREFYEDFFAVGGLRKEVVRLTKNLSVEHLQVIPKVSVGVRKAIVTASFPKEASASLKAYFTEFKTRLLQAEGRKFNICVRTLGDDKISLVRQIGTIGELEKLIKQVYSLLFTDEDILGRLRLRADIVPNSFSVLIQYFPEPEVSGEAIAHDSSLHDDSIIEIKAGHFSSLHNDLQCEDVYRIDKKSLAMLSRQANRHWWAEHTAGKLVSPAHLGKTVAPLSDEQVIKLARMVRQADAQFNDRHSFSWSLGGNQMWITGIESGCECALPSGVESVAPTRTLIQGLPGSYGLVIAPVRLIKSVADQKRLKEGDIAVVSHLSVKTSEWLRTASALISESGSAAGDEAKIAQALLIPAVVGASKALSVLRDGQVVTLDGTTGAIYQGVQTEAVTTKRDPLVTGTQVWTTVMDPYQIRDEDMAESDGVGLLRGEFIIRMLGVHPEDILRKNLAEEYSDILAEGISRVSAMANRSRVVYQLHDLGSMDMIGLKEPAHTRHEPNPSLGYRGTHRLLSEPELLDLEMSALAKVAAKHPEGLEIMLPMVRTLGEIDRMLDYLNKSALAAQATVRVWIKCETPGLLIQMEEVCKLGISGVCFDVPNLTQFIQGIDKDNRQVAHHLDMTDSAVEQALSYAIRVCRYEGIPTMLVAEMEDLRPEIIQSAVEAGLTGVSVAPAMVGETKRLLARAEQRLLLDHALAEQA